MQKVIGGPSQRIAVDVFNPVGAHQQRADLTVARTFDRPNVTPPAYALIVFALTQSVRYTLDGSAPTPTIGFRITAGNDPIVITFGPNTTIRMVEEAATAVLDYQWGQ